jgi:cytochrome c peroxidase
MLSIHHITRIGLGLSILFLAFSSCRDVDSEEIDDIVDVVVDDEFADYLNLDLNDLADYGTDWPEYYDADVFDLDNTPVGNEISSEGATLGRVLFYDKRLSINNEISCASCHQQGNGFTDDPQFSLGFNGVDVTGAHSMRLGNARFYEGIDFFWDRRAASLEEQTTMPIQDAVEMGFDASNGGMDSLIRKMEALVYYPVLFELAFGSEEITEERMQLAMAQFIRSMASVGSEFDEGYSSVFGPGPGNNIGQDFPNFTALENQGKQIFLDPIPAGGAGCAGCHQPPTFSLDGNSRSNGLDAGETTIFKSPSLKNIGLSEALMHDGRFTTLLEVVEHYNSGIQVGPALDPRLTEPGPGSDPVELNLTDTEKQALVAFMETLTDFDLISDPRFSDPFWD